MALITCWVLLIILNSPKLQLQQKLIYKSTKIFIMSSESALRLVELMKMPHVLMCTSFVARTSFLGYQMYAQNVIQESDPSGVSRNNFLKRIVEWQSTCDGPLLRELFARTLPEFVKNCFFDLEQDPVDRITAADLHNRILRTVSGMMEQCWMEFGSATVTKMQQWFDFLIRKSILQGPNPINPGSPNYNPNGRFDLMLFDLRSLYLVISQVVHDQCEQEPHYTEVGTWRLMSGFHLCELFPMIVALDVRNSERMVEVVHVGEYDNIHIHEYPNITPHIHKYHLALCKFARDKLRLESAQRLASSGVTEFNMAIYANSYDQIEYAMTIIGGCLERIKGAEKVRNHYRRYNESRNPKGPRDPIDFENDDHLVGGYQR